MKTFCGLALALVVGMISVGCGEAAKEPAKPATPAAGDTTAPPADGTTAPPADGATPPADGAAPPADAPK